MDQPVWKKANLGFFLSRCFYSLNRLLFFLKLHETQVIDQFCIKAKKKKNLNFFFKKTWPNPLGKMQMRDFLKQCFYSLKRILSFR